MLPSPTFKNHCAWQLPGTHTSGLAAASCKQGRADAVKLPSLHSWLADPFLRCRGYELGSSSVRSPLERVGQPTALAPTTLQQPGLERPPGPLSEPQSGLQLATAGSAFNPIISRAQKTSPELSQKNLTFEQVSFPNQASSSLAAKRRLSIDDLCAPKEAQMQRSQHSTETGKNGFHRATRFPTSDETRWQEFSQVTAKRMKSSAEETTDIKRDGPCVFEFYATPTHRLVRSKARKQQKRQRGSGTNPKQRFPCDQCSKTFSTKSNMEVHKRIHTGTKPFVCSVCGYSSVRKGDLQKHERIHSGTRPFVCYYCGRDFTQSSHLTVHMRQHQSEA